MILSHNLITECLRRHLFESISAISVSKFDSAVSNLIIFGTDSGTFLSSFCDTYLCCDETLCLQIAEAKLKTRQIDAPKTYIPFRVVLKIIKSTAMLQQIVMYQKIPTVAGLMLQFMQVPRFCSMKFAVQTPVSLSHTIGLLSHQNSLGASSVPYQRIRLYIVKAIVPMKAY